MLSEQKKETNYSKSLFNPFSSTVNTRCLRRDVSTQSSTPVEARLSKRAEMDGSVSSSFCLRIDAR